MLQQYTNLAQHFDSQHGNVICIKRPILDIRKEQLLTMVTARKRLKVTTFHIPPLTGKPEQQWFTIRRDVLASISTRQHRPLPE